ncbi:hypothetical protein Tco_1040331 [Tanacetum coccineum]
MKKMRTVAGDGVTILCDGVWKNKGRRQNFGDNVYSLDSYQVRMVEGLKSTGRNLVAIVRDVYVFIGSFTYVIDFVVLEDIGEFIVSDMAEVVMGKPFRKGLYSMRRSPGVLRSFIGRLLDDDLASYHMFLLQY